MVDEGDKVLAVLDVGNGIFGCEATYFGCKVAYSDLLRMTRGELDGKFIEVHPAPLSLLPMGTSTIRRPKFTRADSIVSFEVVDEKIAHAIRKGRDLA